MPDPLAPGHSDVVKAVNTLRLVPDVHRRFRVTTSDVQRIHRIDARLIERLLDLGLPTQGSGEDRRFDALDVANLGLLLDVPSPRRLGMRWWTKAFQTRADQSDLTYTLRFGATASPTDPCSLDPAVVAAGLPVSQARVSGNVITLRARLPGATHYFDRTFEPIITAGSRLQFHLIPPALHEDLGFAAETGLADCKLAARFLVTLGHELELPVRAVDGLFVARPYAFRHDWIELRDGDAWIAADPFFLQALIQWRIIARETWPPHRSPRSVLWRLDAGDAPLMWSGPAPVDAAVAVLEVRQAQDA